MPEVLDTSLTSTALAGVAFRHHADPRAAPDPLHAMLAAILLTLREFEARISHLEAVAEIERIALEDLAKTVGQDAAALRANAALGLATRRDGRPSC